MSWNWLRSKPAAPIGVEGVLCCADALRQLIADHWRFFEQTRGALRGTLINPSTIVKERADLLEALDSWRKHLVSKVSTAFPAGSAEHLIANEALLKLPAEAAPKAAEILDHLALALKPLVLACEPESVKACEALRQATAEFIQLCTGTIVPADEILAAEPPVPARFTEANGLDQPSVYRSREESAWQTVARHCLLHDGFATGFPVAVLLGQRGDEPPCGKVMEFVVEVYQDAGVNLVGPHPAELEVAHDDFRLAVTQAWHAAQHPSSPGHLAVWRVRREADDRDGALSGRSAGGAFGLALLRAMHGRNYPPRVIVLAAINAEGHVVSLGRAGDAEVIASLVKKVTAILNHPRIDTIATVEEHFKQIETLLAGQDRVRVKLIRGSVIEA